MNLDPFGHIAVKRHSIDFYRNQLSKAKTQEIKDLWLNAIRDTEAKITSLERAEMDYWQWLGELSKNSCTGK